MKMHGSMILLLFLGLLSPTFLYGRSGANDDWAGLRALTSGTRVLIDTKDGRTYKGDLNTVTDAAILISTKGKTETIDSSNVKAVYRFGKSSLGKTVAIGAAIGAGAGAGIGIAAIGSTGGSDNVGAVIAPIILVGAGAGALLGALGGKKKKILVYEAK